MIRAASALAVLATALAVTIPAAGQATPTGCTDTSPPTVETVGISRRNVPIGPTMKRLTVTARITDDCSGVNDALMSMIATNGQGQWIDTMKRTGGTATDGTYALTVPFSGHSTISEWEVRVRARDREDRERGLDAGVDRTFRTRYAQRVTVAAARAGGTVRLSGRVQRYAPFRPSGWAPVGGQNVSVVFRAADGRYLFQRVASTTVGPDGRWQAAAPSRVRGYWYGQVFRTTRLSGVTSPGVLVGAR